jgi:hypothetical protein
MAAAACTTGACQQMAVAADTTPPAQLAINGMNTPVTCANCFNWQINSCISAVCTAEYDAFNACVVRTMSAMMCQSMAEGMALNTCVMTNMAAFQSCGDMRVPLCFPGTGGFLPDFRPRSFRVDFDAYEQALLANPYWH